MGIFDREFTPQDLALMQAGATMWGQAHKGFGPALSAGVSAGLNEYARGVGQAEQLRKNQRLEELRQRQVDISAGTLAQRTAYNERSLDLQEKQLRQQELLDKSRLGVEKRKLALEQEASRLTGLLTEAQAGHYGAQTDTLRFTLQQQLDAVEAAKNRQKLEEELAKKEAEKPGFFARLFAPRPATPTPLAQRDPSSLTTSELMQLATQRQQQSMDRQREIDELMSAFKDRDEQRQMRQMLQQMVTQPPGAMNMGAPTLPGMMQRYR